MFREGLSEGECLAADVALPRLIGILRHTGTESDHGSYFIEIRQYTQRLVSWFRFTRRNKSTSLLKILAAKR